jgi:hypothetical protein
MALIVEMFRYVFAIYFPILRRSSPLAGVGRQAKSRSLQQSQSIFIYKLMEARSDASTCVVAIAVAVNPEIAFFLWLDLKFEYSQRKFASMPASGYKFTLHE